MCILTRHRIRFLSKNVNDNFIGKNSQTNMKYGTADSQAKEKNHRSDTIIAYNTKLLDAINRYHV